MLSPVNRWSGSHEELKGATTYEQKEEAHDLACAVKQSNPIHGKRRTAALWPDSGAAGWLEARRGGAAHRDCFRSPGGSKRQTYSGAGESSRVDHLLARWPF